MDMKHEVGTTAGRIWQLLQDNGPLTAVHLKKKLNGPGDLPEFAIGWLARENKVELVREKKTVRVQLS